MQDAQKNNENQNIFADVIAHNLRIFGLPAACGHKNKYKVFRSSEIEQAESWANKGGVAIVWVEPDERVLMGEVLQWHFESGVNHPMRPAQPDLSPHCKIATLFPYASFPSNSQYQVIVTDGDGRNVWVWKSQGEGGLLLLGTDVAGDLVQFRQGDPEQAVQPDTTTRWGIAGERPNYLYEKQREGAAPYDRYADWWAMVLAQILADLGGTGLLPILPNNAKGAIVITGDDDQAYLEKYQEQLQVLSGLPITYFLHPLTRHTEESLKSITGREGVDLGIHPDALDAPESYEDIFAEQAIWYHEKTGKRAISVRNHGFLNNGYWGHLKAWRKEGVKISSNIPGLEGNLISSSLIPARVCFEDALTDHWSIITAIGDGIVFVHNMSSAESRKCVLDLGSEIVESRLPGVMVLNLHPQNVTEAMGMHEAIKELIAQGFVVWNLQDCLDWFRARDEGRQVTIPDYSFGKPGFGKKIKIIASRLLPNALSGMLRDVKL